MSRKILSILPLFLLTLLAQGCLDVKHRYTLNPDGSGKVTVESVVKPFSFEEPEKNRKKQINDFVQGVIEGSEGVDVWKDINCTLLPDGKISFKGTAYFRDLNELNLKEVGLSRYTLETENGEMVLALSDKKEDDEAESSTESQNLTEEEIAAAIDSVKEQFQMARGMMAVFLEELKERNTFELPGSVRQVQGFTQNADGTIGMNYDGKRILAILDSMMEVPGFWRQMVLDKAKGKQGPEKEEEMMRLMFGAAKPKATTVPGASPLFDYKGETTAARKKYPALLKRFGMKG